MTFIEKLKTVQAQNDTLLCVGLDTDIAKIPAALRSRPDAQLEFNKRIIDATHDLVCAYKINFAFYEAYGARGWETIVETVKHIPQPIVTIADAKRGDIGNSSGYYAHAILEEMRFDSVTVAPYMGRDSVEPFLFSEDKGVFLLALTSNDGARDFQMMKSGEKRMFEHVIRKSLKWNAKNNLGYVVGATKASELKRVREMAPDVPLLIPGVGAQGGDLKNVVRYGCDANGDLAVVNASRSVLYASKNDHDFAEAARHEAARLRDAMNSVREKYF
jgi:orotidine-5'-phosphate decarboxylase